MIFFIINIKSGSKSTSSKAQLIQKLNKIENSSLHFTEFSGHGGELAKLAISQQATKIIVVGGDGTINEVASALVGSNIPLGIIPIGSGNGLARHLQIPLTPRKALAHALLNKNKRIDVGFINERPFFCTAGIGFDAQVAHQFAKNNKRGLINYIKATFITLFKFKPILIHFEGKQENLFSKNECNSILTIQQCFYLFQK